MRAVSEGWKKENLEAVWVPENFRTWTAYNSLFYVREVNVILSHHF
jgi:hypothetical protein